MEYQDTTDAQLQAEFEQRNANLMNGVSGVLGSLNSAQKTFRETAQHNAQELKDRTMDTGFVDKSMETGYEDRSIGSTRSTIGDAFKDTAASAESAASTASSTMGSKGFSFGIGHGHGHGHGIADNNMNNTIDGPSVTNSSNTTGFHTADTLNSGAIHAARRDINAMHGNTATEFETVAAKIDDTFAGNALTEGGPDTHIL
ncbi:hypothetical protein J3Q64DRAFT_1774902 [Phycomyces blakesleeanus]|uniref:Uncharacterized protein n=2 Tax=Phycomyces blakesleeanus TaxID=4837 RepID=A0A167JP18_PHYB8|nr:hypothetical protein PHYBLDRAFT_70869 [Phycomyces blakesleeanus NRRL 1555(-)]OAD66408.1 hypothetical protein PHYBLDRAFT_70869 [Phycomyces blakesleeanus NRRL 1555(-)]|eukprot:XP_018284448.1 hypothetical protein PHYBLDRAFT_70869 [Phycomyces blakesleeanus NRRL 1555(-)]